MPQACSTRRKKQCTPPCNWIIGVGCRGSPGSPRCRSDQILNPATNRCVNKTGVIGKRILESRERRRSPPPKHKKVIESPPKELEIPSKIFDKCASNKVLNPKTGRCVLRRGTIGKKILEAKGGGVKFGNAPVKDAFQPISADHDLELDRDIAQIYGKKIFSVIAEVNGVHVEDVKFIQKVKQGDFGSVYTASIDGKAVVIKFEFFMKNERSMEHMEHENKMHIMFYNEKVGAPKPYFFKFMMTKNRFNSVFISGMKLDEYALNFGLFQSQLETPQTRDMLNYMLESIGLIIDQMCRKNLIHGDLHWDNIGFQNKESQSKTVIGDFAIFEGDVIAFRVSPLVIDFGFSKEGKCMPGLEIIQLIRTLFPGWSGVKDIHRRNRDYLYENLVRMLKHYEPSIVLPNKNTDWNQRGPFFKEIDKIFGRLRAKLRHN